MRYTPPACPTVSADQLAQWLGYANAAGFQNASRKLIAQHGFPRKLPGVRRWSRDAVLQWIARQGGVDPAHAISGAPVLEVDDTLLEQTRKDLERLYANDGFRPGQFGEAAE